MRHWNWRTSIIITSKEWITVEHSAVWRWWAAAAPFDDYLERWFPKWPAGKYGNQMAPKPEVLKNLKRETLKTKTVFMIMILNPNIIQKFKALFTKSTVLFDIFFISGSKFLCALFWISDQSHQCSAPPSFLLWLATPPISHQQQILKHMHNNANIWQGASPFSD